MLKKVNNNLQFLDGPKCLLGESPVWLKKEKTISWIDILKKKIYFYNTVTQKLIKVSLKEKPGFIESYNVKSIIIGLESGLYLYDFKKNFFKILCRFKKNNFRVNDGYYDKNKRIWFNLYDEKKKLPGSLNFYYKNKITKIASDLLTPNGPIIHYRTKKIFFTDTRKKIIYSKDLNNLRKKRKIFFSYGASNIGSPDGMQIVKDNLWVAFYRGSSIKVINLLGKIKKTIKLPTSLVTNLTFCDKNKKSFFITTAYKDLSKKQLKTETLAGNLLLYKFR